MNAPFTGHIANPLEACAVLDAYDGSLRDDPIWEYLSRKEQETFGWTAMSIAQEGIEDECEAGRKLVALLREYAPKAFAAMKEEREEERAGL